MASPDLDERFRRSRLERYLLAEEEVIIAQRKHWVVLVEPIASTAAGLVVVLAIDYRLPASLSLLTNLFWWAWIFLVGRLVYTLLVWRRSWLVATDKRLLVNHGLLIQEGVAMIALGRVVDLTYTRSGLGMLLGYGTLVRESAGHSQTLHKVEWVSHPDSTYLTICATIFGLQDRGRGTEEDLYGHRFQDGPLEHAPGLHAPYVPPHERARSGTESSVSEEQSQSEDSTGIRIRYGASKPVRRDDWQQSADLREPALLRDADTGPINYRRPATDLSQAWTPTTEDDGTSDDDDNDDDDNSDDG